MQPLNELRLLSEQLSEKQRRNRARRNLTECAIHRGFKPASHHRLIAALIQQFLENPLEKVPRAMST
jgi:hypothetical protein